MAVFGLQATYAEELVCQSPAHADRKLASDKQFTERIPAGCREQGDHRPFPDAPAIIPNK